MTLILTAEEESLRDSVRRFVADRSPLTKVRDLIAAGEPYDAEVWKQLAAQLGLAGLIIPAEYGGAGAGLVRAQHRADGTRGRAGALAAAGREPGRWRAAAAG